MTQRLTSQRLNELCTQFAGLDKLRTQMTNLRSALADKGFAHASIEGIAQQLSTFAFSIDNAIASSSLSASSQTALTNILLDKLQHTYTEYSTNGTAITASCHDGDAQMLYVPSTATVSGSCEYAFRQCYSLIYVSPDIDWTPATSLSYLFYSCGTLQNSSLTFNLPNCTTIAFMTCRAQALHFTNLNGTARLINVAQAFQGPTSLITGLDFSYVATNQNGVFNSGNNLSNAEIYLAEGSKIQHSGAVWYFVNGNYSNYSTAHGKLISTASLWRMIKALYDYNDSANETDAQGRSLVLTKSASLNYQFINSANTARRTELETYISDNEDDSQTELRAFLTAKGVDHSSLTDPADLLSAYMTAKGWTY